VLRFERGDIIGGLTTFLTVAYILVVNPAILSTEGTGISFSGAMTATVLLAATMTLFMGLYADLPFAVAPGMGINAFFTYTLILGKGIPWQTALGMVFWSGILFLLISITPVRVWMVKAVPKNLRIGAAVGIGLFLSFIGLRNGMVVKAHPATFVTFAGWSPQLGLMLVSLFCTLILTIRHKPYAMLAGMGVATTAAFVLGYAVPPSEWISAPDLTSVMMQLDIWGALKWSLAPAIVSLMCTDLFDSISTFIGVSQATGMTTKEGEPKGLYRGLIVDSFATFAAGLLGTSAGTAYIESAAGIQAGGRTGKASVITALCFVPCLFFAPLAGAIPPYATAAVLVLVGASMFSAVRHLNWENMEDVLPAFITVMMIPLSFSITQGIFWGMIVHVVSYLVAGRRRDLSPTLIIMAVGAVLLLSLEH